MGVAHAQLPDMPVKPGRERMAIVGFDVPSAERKLAEDVINEVYDIGLTFRRRRSGCALPLGHFIDEFDRNIEPRRHRAMRMTRLDMRTTAQRTHAPSDDGLPIMTALVCLQTEIHATA